MGQIISLWVYQVTKVNDCVSDTCEAKCEVPPGSKRGPLLFTIYVNELPSQVTQDSSYICGDDTAISVNGLNVQETERESYQNSKMVQ